MKKRLVLIGAGHAHLHMLKSLTMLAPQPFDGVEITLISPFAQQVYSAMLPGWVAGHYDISQCVIPLLPLAGRADALFRQTAATWPEDTGFDISRDVLPVLAVSLEVVQALFRRYGLLDEKVQFLKGWFKDSLPNAPIGHSEARWRSVSVNHNGTGANF